MAEYDYARLQHSRLEIEAIYQLFLWSAVGSSVLRYLYCRFVHLQWVSVHMYCLLLFIICQESGTSTNNLDQLKVVLCFCLSSL
jgi:hypothetical protein